MWARASPAQLRPSGPPGSLPRPPQPFGSPVLPKTELLSDRSVPARDIQPSSENRCQFVRDAVPPRVLRTFPGPAGAPGSPPFSLIFPLSSWPFTVCATRERPRLNYGAARLRAGRRGAARKAAAGAGGPGRPAPGRRARPGARVEPPPGQLSDFLHFLLFLPPRNRRVAFLGKEFG